MAAFDVFLRTCFGRRADGTIGEVECPPVANVGNGGNGAGFDVEGAAFGIPEPTWYSPLFDPFRNVETLPEEGVPLAGPTASRVFTPAPTYSSTLRDIGGVITEAGRIFTTGFRNVFGPSSSYTRPLAPRGTIGRTPIASLPTSQWMSPTLWVVMAVGLVLVMLFARRRA